MSQPLPSDETLVSRARAGDRAAFGTLVERYEDQVAATITGMLGPGADVDDVAQEVFIRFFEALGRFRGDASVGTYVTRIAINLSLNAIKRRTRRQARFTGPEDAATVEAPSTNNTEAREQALLVHRALQSLDPKHRAVVVLRMIEGFSTKETAAMLDVPVGTVLSRLSRALDKLRQVLAPYVGELPG